MGVEIGIDHLTILTRADTLFGPWPTVAEVEAT
jgi:hypothetical protein